jgi:copper chaperone CopZ
MKKIMQGVTVGLFAAMFFLGGHSAHAFDAKYKYIIPTMKTQQDVDKVTAFIKTLPGIMDITVLLDNHEIILFFDDEELDDEKMQLRIPLKKEIGYPVERYDILYEDPNKRN